MKRVLGLVIVLMIAGAYAAGLWPERQRRLAAESELQALRGRLDEAEARVRLGKLLGDAITLREVVSQRNYGQAQSLATAFFDRVRAESSRAAPGGLRQALEAVHERRDAVTVSLTQADPVALDHLRLAEESLRAALGLGASAVPPPTASTSLPPATSTPAAPPTPTPEAGPTATPVP